MSTNIKCLKLRSGDNAILYFNEGLVKSSYEQNKYKFENVYDIFSTGFAFAALTNKGK